MVCATKVCRARVVSSDAFAEEKLRTMRAFGADLGIIPGENRRITAKLIDSLVERARELSKQPNTIWTDQFSNVDNRNAYHTGGSFFGSAEVLKEKIPTIHCIPVEPLHVRSFSRGDTSGFQNWKGLKRDSYRRSGSWIWQIRLSAV